MSYFEQWTAADLPFLCRQLSTWSQVICLSFMAYGPNYALTTACTTGTDSIGMAARNISYGEVV